MNEDASDEIVAHGPMVKISGVYKRDIDDLFWQLAQLMDEMPNNSDGDILDQTTDSSAHPQFWVSQWTDYSEKYGFGYQLNDESTGVVFNDKSRIFMSADGSDVQYIHRDGSEKFITSMDFPESLANKMKLLSFFKRYMTENLVAIKAVRAINVDFRCIPQLLTWFRTARAVVMHFTNGCVQLNFSDHIKIILCPHASAITYINSELRTYKFKQILNTGCSNDLQEKLRYAHAQLMRLLEQTDG